MAEEILTHSRAVIDDDPEFVIDAETKKITAGSVNLTLAQFSKNSERLTFYISGKTIEGHDMSECNSVEIHFQNIKEDLTARNLGIYSVTDLKVQEDDSVTLSWLVDDDATQYAGGLIFSIHFACIDETGELIYDFPTLTYSGLTVGETVWNSATLVTKYPDIIAEFDARIAALEAGGGGGTAVLPKVSEIDFTNFASGSFTEVVDGETVNHAVTFDSQGRPSKIDDIVIKWG